MAKIHHLSPYLIAKIAAGEVIERPSFAVKELIENAIDAKADEISVYIEESGMRKIQVVDNGEGMSEEDLKESWKPHTTSKITEEDSLIGIKSFGFRGEALASLAAVSHLTIRSRTTANSTGVEIQIVHNKLLATHPIGMPEGTVVIAENLFGNIPARKKFLKSPQTELRHIIDVVTQFAITYPLIHFRLIHNKRSLIDTPKTNNQKERLSLLLDKNFSFYLPVRKEESYITMTGFIAKPQLASTTSTKQFLFVNNRKVSDKLISLAVKEAYGTMLEPTAFPLFVLFITLPHEMVDVNVHPRKEQVSFVNTTVVFQVVKEKITEVLQENNITFQNLSWKRSGVGTTRSFAANLLRENVLEKETLFVDEKEKLIQLNKLYILASQKNGFFFVDQHAGHERILFEKLKEEFLTQKKKAGSVKLQKPIVLQLSAADVILFNEYQKVFSSLDFIVVNKTEKNNTIAITHIPFLFQDRNPEELVREIFGDLLEEKPINSIDKVSEEMMAFLACRAAVKAGDSLKENQMKEIIEKLENAPNNTTCPHGRPTRIYVSFEEINALFKRH